MFIFSGQPASVGSVAVVRIVESERGHGVVEETAGTGAATQTSTTTAPTHTLPQDIAPPQNSPI